MRPLLFISSLHNYKEMTNNNNNHSLKYEDIYYHLLDILELQKALLRSY